jgi:hypothetical protein
MSDADDTSHLSTASFPDEVIPTEEGEGLLTSEESRAKADPHSPTGPGARTDDDESTDPNAQPPL